MDFVILFFVEGQIWNFVVKNEISNLTYRGKFCQKRQIWNLKFDKAGSNLAKIWKIWRSNLMRGHSISTTPIMLYSQWIRVIYCNSVDWYVIVITSMKFGSFLFHPHSDICIPLFDVFCGNYPFSHPLFTMPLHASWGAQSHCLIDWWPLNSI